MFVWVEVFALIVGFLCACGVRRFRGLWRVCLYFVLFCPLLSSFLSSLMSFCSCVCLSFCPLCSCFYLFSCFPRLVLLAAWLLILVLSSLSLWVVGFLSLSDGFRYKKKGRVLRPFLWSCVVVLECFRNYETIVGRFNPERVPCYPSNCKKIATM